MLGAFLKRMVDVFEEPDVQLDLASPSLKNQEAYLRDHSLSSLLPYYSYDDTSKIFINKHSCGFVIEVTPLLGFNSRIEAEISGLFKTILPPGDNIQFLMIGSPKIGAFLDNWEEKRKDKNSVLKSLASKRVYYLKGPAGGASPFKNYRLIISYSRHMGKKLEKLEEYHKKQIKELRAQIITLFESIGLGVRGLDAPDLLTELSTLLKCARGIYHHHPVWNQLQDLSSQVLNHDTSIQIKNNGILVNEGECLMRTYTVNSYPSSWYLGSMDNLIGDNFRNNLQITCPFMISYNVHVSTDAWRKGKLLTKGARVESQSASVLAKWLPSIVKEADEWRFVREQIESGERLLETSYQICLFSTPENIANDEQSLLSLYRSNQWELVSDKYIQLPSLISMLPMSWGEGMNIDMSLFNRTRVTLSHEPVNVLPIQGEWGGTKSACMALSSRKGQLFYWSPFDNESGNYNVCVVGRSGSGKSVFMQELMSSILGEGGKVFVLDVGRSFEKAAKLLGGDFIEFSTSSAICLNPFSTITEATEDATSSALSMLKPIVALMCAPKAGVTDIEYSYIEKAIVASWQSKKTNAGISDIADVLSSYPEKVAQDLATMLYPYTLSGSYGKFFNGAASITFDNQINVIELEELKERKDLQAVIVQIFILQITNRMFLGDRQIKYAIVFDEAWDMLRGKQSGEFIELLARRLRKYNGSLIVGTQGINDFYQTPGAQAAFDNSDWVCMLSQKQESIEQLKKSGKFHVTDHMEEMLVSVNTKQGKYAEVMITSSNGYFIGRLILDPFSKILYSTKAEEYRAVKKLEEEGASLEEALSNVAAEVYKGE